MRTSLKIGLTLVLALISDVIFVSALTRIPPVQMGQMVWRIAILMFIIYSGVWGAIINKLSNSSEENN